MAQMRKYYEAQLRFLREQSREFVARYPKLAPYLGEAAHDPDIERLLEGFAFISGKLWHKIEDAYPEISEQLLEFIAPNYLKPLPACSILEFLPKISQGNTEKLIKRETLIDTQRDEQRYFFSTCYDTQVLPMKLVSVKSTHEYQELKLSLDFELLGAANLQHLPPYLRLYFSGDLTTAYWCYYLFLNQLSSARLVVDGRVHELSNLQCLPVGFTGDESLLPCREQDYQVEQHLLEYYSFPQKFMFVDLGKLSWQLEPYAQNFTLEFSLKLPLRLSLHLDLEHFKINCCPIMNIWEQAAVPLLHKHEQRRYLLRASDFNAAVHSVTQVEAWSDVARAHYVYYPAYQQLYPVRDQRLYQVHLVEDGVDEIPNVYVELWDETVDLSEHLTLSPKVLVYQPQVHLHLQQGDIVDGVHHLLGCAYKNVSALSAPVYPPLGRALSWCLLSALALRYKNLTDLDGWRALLMHHDFSVQHGERYEGNGQRVAMSLQMLKHSSSLKFYKGEMLRGFVTEVLVRDEVFLNVGELYLFGSVLAKILQDRAAFNSFHDLQFKNVASGQVLTWTTSCA